MRVKDVVLVSFLAAIVIVVKELLAFIPNVELVTFLLIIYALNMKLSKSVMVTVIFCFVQIPLYGMGTWTFVYFIIWPALVVMVYYLKPWLINYQRLALFSGLFGLCFGFVFALPYFMISLTAGWGYFVRGIMFDLVHCFSNYIIMVILYDKANEIMKKMLIKYQ